MKIFTNIFASLSIVLLLGACSNSAEATNAKNIAFVDSLISKMTLEEKLGQMTQVDRQFLNDISDGSKYGFGSLLSGGGSTPEVNEPRAWADMYDNYQKEALKSRLQIPLLYGIDAVHVITMLLGQLYFLTILDWVQLEIQKLLKPLQEQQLLK